MIPASAAVISGRDPRNGGEPFVNQFFLAQTGGAGTAWARRLAHALPRRLRGHAPPGQHRDRRDAAPAARCGSSDSSRTPRVPAAIAARPPPTSSTGRSGTSLTAAYGCDGAVNPALGVRGGLPGGPAKHLKRDRTVWQRNCPQSRWRSLKTARRSSPSHVEAAGTDRHRSVIRNWFATTWSKDGSPANGARGLQGRRLR